MKDSRGAAGRYEPDGFRSWIVAFVGGIALIVTFGTPLSYGVFLSALSEEYGVSAVAISVVFSIKLFLFFAGAGVIGIFTTRLPSRVLLLSCSILAGLTAPSLYLFDSFVWLVIVLGTFGLLLGVVYVVLAGIVPLWFQNRRGIATGVASTGIGLSLFIMPPAWEIAFSWYGVRSGFFIVTGISASVIFISAIVCHRPFWTEPSNKDYRDLTNWLRRLSRTRFFGSLFIGIGLSLAWYYLLAAYSIDLLVSRGLTETAAALGFGLIGGTSILSRLGSGFVADRIGFRRTFLFSVVCATTGSLLLFVPYLPITAASIFLFGIALGGAATVHIPFLLQLFGEDSDVAVVGLFNISFGVFGLAAPPVVSVVMSHTDSFTILIGLTFSITVVAFWSVAVSTRDPQFGNLPTDSKKR